MIASLTCPRCRAENASGQQYCQKCGCGLLRTNHIPAEDLEGGPHDLIGRVLGGKYKVVDLLGEGGFGTVYRVEQLLLGRNMEFALKLLHPRLSENERFRSRFVREASIAMELVHAHAIPVRDFGQTEDGLLYFTMDYCRGESLKRALQREHLLSLNRAISITRQILLVLEAAHEKQIIHRDLKPENIFLETSSAGQTVVKVGDFGLARNIGRELVDADLTGGGIVGTPRYMSPEQARAEPLDGRSDLYSVGVMFYEMISGDLPPRLDKKARAPADIPQRSVQVRLREHLPENLVVPAALLDVIARALEQRPTGRFQSAREFLDAVEALPTYTPTYSDPAAVRGAKRPARRRRRRRRALGALVATALLSAGAAFAYPPARGWIVEQLRAASLWPVFAAPRDGDGAGAPGPGAAPGSGGKVAAEAAAPALGGLRQWIPYEQGDVLVFSKEVFQADAVERTRETWRLLDRDPRFGLRAEPAGEEQLPPHWLRVEDDRFVLVRAPVEEGAAPAEEVLLRWRDRRPVLTWTDGPWRYQVSPQVERGVVDARVFEDCLSVRAIGEGPCEGQERRWVYALGVGLLQERVYYRDELTLQRQRILEH